ncbi:MAG: hypothetical protein ABEK04_03505 [Candidatus Nanohalobium sp.]
MNSKHSVAGLVLLTLLASGCMGGGGDTGLNIGPGGKTITVTSFEVQPRSILAGSSTQVQLGLVNTGVMDANITIGEDGREILRNFCPDIFQITSFNAYSSRVSSTQNQYTLKPGDKLQLSWGLKNSNTGSVPTYGYKCPLSMQIPFDYGVSAYQQLQVKKNKEIQGSTNIQSRTSQGPLNLHLEMIGSTSEKGSPTFIKGDNMEVLVQMENTAPKESSYQGLVNLEKPVIATSERFLINRSSCNMETKVLGSSDTEVSEKVLKMIPQRYRDQYEGESSSDNLVHGVKIDKDMRLYQGQSRIVRCGVVLRKPDGSGALEGAMDAPSVKGQVEAYVDYTYVKDLGETQVKVEYRG